MFGRNAKLASGTMAVITVSVLAVALVGALLVWYGYSWGHRDGVASVDAPVTRSSKPESNCEWAKRQYEAKANDHRTENALRHVFYAHCPGMRPSR